MDELLFNISPDSLLDLRDSEKLTYDSLGVLKEKFEYIVILTLLPVGDNDEVTILP